jgi:hypothetical protein
LFAISRIKSELRLVSPSTLTPAIKETQFGAHGLERHLSSTNSGSAFHSRYNFRDRQIARLRLGKQALDLQTADTQKGVYKGEVLGSSKWHVVQRVGNSHTAVAHFKDQLDAPEVSGKVAIVYSRGKGAVSHIEERQRRRNHPRELALRR